MSDIELVIKNSKKLEGLLEKHFAATGRGLHEKVGSVERKLPDGVVRRLRFIATIRNKIVHEESYDKIDVFKLRDGRLVEFHEYYDTAKAMAMYRPELSV